MTKQELNVKSKAQDFFNEKIYATRINVFFLAKFIVKMAKTMFFFGGGFLVSQI